MNYEGAVMFRDVRVPGLEGPDIVAEPDITGERVVYTLAGERYDVPRQIAGDTPLETRENVREYILEQGHPRLSDTDGSDTAGDAENDISGILSGEEPMLGGVS